MRKIICAIIGLILLATHTHAKPISLTNWTSTPGTAVGVERIANGAEMTEALRIAFRSHESDEWPEAKQPLRMDLSQQDRLSFRLKVSQTTPSGHIILYDANGSRAIQSMAALVGTRDIPGNAWLNLAWDFQQHPGWVTGTTGGFDYTRVEAISIGFTRSKLPAEGIDFLVADLKLTKTDRGDAEEQRFIENYPEGSTDGKKAILWLCARDNVAGGMASIEYLADPRNMDRIRDLPFDGLICEPLPFPFRDRIFSSHTYPEATFERAIELGKTIDFGRFKHNFLRIDIVAQQKGSDGKVAPFDWFDDTAWQAVLQKAKQIARTARQLGFKGIVFDNETYRPDHPFDYYNEYRKTGRSFETYQQQVRQRAKTFIEAMTAEYPGLTIIYFFGNWHLKFTPEEDLYGLLPAFTDGMLEARGNPIIIDGYEDSYEYRDRESFIKGRYRIRTGEQISLAPQRYRDQLNIGFGIWLRPTHIQPDAFRHAVETGLKVSDEYVWIYSERNVFTDELKAYFDALRDIK